MIEDMSNVLGDGRGTVLSVGDGPYNSTETPQRSIEMPTIDEPTSQPTNKVTAATIGASIGAALYSLAETKFELLKNPEIKISLLPVFIAACTLGPAWFKRNLTAFSQEVHAGRNWWVMIGSVAGVAVLGAAVGYLIR